MSTHVLTLCRRIEAAPERIFAALTDPVQIARWLIGAPEGKAEVEADVRVGGAYRLRMEEPDGTSYEPHGEYLEIDAPRRLVFTWSCRGYCDDSIVTIELVPASEGTDVILRHELPDDDFVISAHESGWAWCLTRLDALVTDGPVGRRHFPMREMHKEEPR